MKILVTGGAGFIGTNLIKRLLELGHEVTSIDNYSTGLKLNEIDGCEYINDDVKKILSLEKTFDFVYHLAAIPRIQPSFKIPDKYIEDNFLGTYEVVKFCIKNDCPLIYAGSSSKHGGKYLNPYTFSKDLGEDIIKLYELHFGLKSNITRFYNVYGPNQLIDGEYTTLIGKWISNIKQNKDCYIYGSGEQRRDFTHVYDIVDALILIMEKNLYGHEFELGRGENYSINEIAEMFKVIPKYLDPKPGETEYTLNTSKLAKELLGWQPKIDVKNYIYSQIS